MKVHLDAEMTRAEIAKEKIKGIDEMKKEENLQEMRAQDRIS